MQADEVLASYLEAVRLGESVAMMSEDRLVKIPASKINSAPLFDFAFMNDPASPDFWSKAIYDSLWNEWNDQRTSFRLPYDDLYCYFSYRSFVMTHNLYHLAQDEEGMVHLETWTWQPSLPGLQSKWTRHPCTIAFDPARPADYVMSWPFDPGRRTDEFWIDERTIDAKSNISVSLAAIQLIHRSGTRIHDHDAAPSVLKVNAKRERVKLDPISRPIVVRLTDREAVLSGPRRTNAYAARSPHDRRGHYRHYRDGRKVWIRSCKIHGGRDTSPVYVGPTNLASLDA